MHHQGTGSKTDATLTRNREQQGVRHARETISYCCQKNDEKASKHRVNINELLIDLGSRMSILCTIQRVVRSFNQLSLVLRQEIVSKSSKREHTHYLSIYFLLLLLVLLHIYALENSS